MRLTGAEVSRAGRTARTWNDGTTKVDLLDSDSDEHNLRLKFSLSSKGGGITDIQLSIGSKDFAALAAAMVSADRGPALREMAAILAREVAKQPDYDRVTTRKARETGKEAGRRETKEAPEGRDPAARPTR